MEAYLHCLVSGFENMPTMARMVALETSRIVIDIAADDAVAVAAVFQRAEVFGAIVHLEYASHPACGYADLIAASRFLKYALMASCSSRLPYCWMCLSSSDSRYARPSRSYIFS